MRVETLSMQGSWPLNEDALLINAKNRIYGVADGATSLVPYVNDRRETGGYLAASLIREYVENLQGEGELRHHLKTANGLLREAMVRAAVDVRRKEALWSAAVALVRIDDTGIEYAQTGDCMIFAVYRGNRIRPLTFPQTEHVEAEAFAKWEAGIARGIATYAELRDSVHEIFVRNRQRANAPDGYGVLNGMENAGDFVESGRISRSNLQALVLLTDGLFMPRKRGCPDPDWAETVGPILEKGLEAYAADLLRLENGDPECLQYVRFKKSDDKTGIVIRF
ncbi:protein phosphatase 2C domain-containing protein [Brevibacillus sp. SYP-B805]|uniref:protein phosphatase 2C domain-containing protein n=1 Tax=Brevibacillus sp. SYP-B805 TaxID=1578199 RepID=UPI0013EC17B9|nr:protein phosphatase 2C domain-containing protein [Brevibacillus sp. SYP-B805]NGQ97372.1 protein phosphatase 2C domain-containing protein [Brevibacillus sp. SYP-B805]